MQKANIVFTGLFILSIGFFSYVVFLGENALVKRTEITKDVNGGYQVITNRTDGSQIIETYEVDANGTPLSHTLAIVDAEPGSEPRAIKQGTFVPKFN